MKKLLLTALIIAAISANARQSGLIPAEEAWRSVVPLLEKFGKNLPVSGKHLIFVTDSCPIYVYELFPTGYVVMTGLPELPRLLAYSSESQFGEFNSENPLYSLVVADVKNRMAYLKNAGGAAFAGKKTNMLLFEQWPSTGDGWLKTNFTQNSPYNDMCPMDLITSTRSYAGCPSVAMAQILNFHKTTNNTHFDDGDDYWHGYAGRNYQIDDDYASVGFPSFPDLNTYLDTLNAHYNAGVSITNQDKAALVFACGVACTQVYTSEGSGTFGVDQAYDAFIRFDFTTSELLTNDDPDLFDRLSQNIKDTLPAHLAVVDPGWTTGHNVVVDGYNTDNYYHVNFGWGGSYNGWYLLPEELPYNLTVIEGVILDINLDTTTSVKYSSNHPADRLLVYPNPCSIDESLHIFADAGNDASYSIYDSMGKEVMAGSYTGNAITLRPYRLKDGIYMIRIQTKKGWQSGKFILE